MCFRLLTFFKKKETMDSTSKILIGVGVAALAYYAYRQLKNKQDQEAIAAAKAKELASSKIPSTATPGIVAGDMPQVKDDIHILAPAGMDVPLPVGGQMVKTPVYPVGSGGAILFDKPMMEYSTVNMQTV
jgi:hypothetical protein